MYNEEEEYELDRDVNSIISQIKSQGKSIKNIQKERPELNKEDIEKFIIDNASSIVSDSIEMVQGLKLDVLAGGDAKMVEATAELVKAVTGALDALSKLKLSDDKIKSQKELKQMDIDSKGPDLIGGGQSGLFISREDLIKNLLTNAKESDKTFPDENIVDI